MHVLIVDAHHADGTRSFYIFAAPAQLLLIAVVPAARLPGTHATANKQQARPGYMLITYLLEKKHNTAAQQAVVVS